MTARQQAIFTLDELAAYLKVGKRTLCRLAAHREIPAFKVGGTWRFRRTEIDRWITPCRLGALSVAADKRSERESSIFLLEV